MGKRYDPVFTSYEPTFDGETEGRNAHIDPPVPIGDPRLRSLDRLTSR